MNRKKKSKMDHFLDYVKFKFKFKLKKKCTYQLSEMGQKSINESRFRNGLKNPKMDQMQKWRNGTKKTNGSRNSMHRIWMEKSKYPKLFIFQNRSKYKNRPDLDQNPGIFVTSEKLHLSLSSM